MLIGLCGKMGSGKSTVLDIIRKEYSYVANLRFSSTLYELQDLIYSKCGITLEGAKDRELLQYLGTDWGRKKDANIWVNAFINKYLAEDMKNMLVVCDDLRFINEAGAIRALGGEIVKISGPQRGEYVSSTNHASEKEIDQIHHDYELNNTGSLYELKTNIKSIMQDIGVE